MHLLRSLISLESKLQDVNDQSVYSEANDESINTSKRQFQSATELIRSKLSPKSNKSKILAYSSVHLRTHKQIQIEQKLELSDSQLTAEHEEQLHIHIEDSSQLQIKSLKISLPSNFDLNKLDEEEENENEININCNDETPSISLHTSISSNITNTEYNSDSMLNDSMYTLPDITAETYCDSNIISMDNECDNLDSIHIGIFPTKDFKFMYNIGHGAFGIVHKEFHMPSCQIVAIKHCRSSNCESIKAFKKEIKICEEFANCNYIINMIEYGLIKEENKICIALEYMNMSSLNKNRFIFDNNTILRIKYVCFCLLQALKCLHNNLYIHNDIKPGNILFNDHCDIKLTDFGCIKQMKNIDIPLTKPTGTEYYQSYEKRFISPVKYTTKSDIYSFGITICELLLYNKQINKNILIPFEIPKEIIETYSETNSDLIDFLNKTLDRNYKTRWDAEELFDHSFLKNSENNSLNDMDKIEDIDDLEFMTSKLIDYYSGYENQIDISAYNTPVTPIDNIWSDSKRIQNMAESSGFSEEFVKDFVSQKVSNVKNKLLKF